jgi:hypothetical protein
MFGAIAWRAKTRLICWRRPNVGSRKKIDASAHAASGLRARTR